MIARIRAELNRQDDAGRLRVGDSLVAATLDGPPLAVISGTLDLGALADAILGIDRERNTGRTARAIEQCIVAVREGKEIVAFFVGDVMTQRRAIESLGAALSIQPINNRIAIHHAAAPTQRVHVWLWDKNNPAGTTMADNRDARLHGMDWTRIHVEIDHACGSVRR